MVKKLEQGDLVQQDDSIQKLADLKSPSISSPGLFKNLWLTKKKVVLAI
jgi:hypothetical protein